MSATVWSASGSPSGRLRHLPVTLVALVTLVTADGCGTRPQPSGPVGSAERWTFPLIGPLEDGLLLTPVSIDGRGPFVFAIDPDANVSNVDDTVVRTLGLRTRRGPARLDEAGHERPRAYAELPSIELGGLILENREAMIVRAGTFDHGGRRIHGVLGRDVIPDSFVFGFERGRGLGHVVLAEAFQPPAGALRLGYRVVPSRRAAAVVPVDRRVVRASIGDGAATFAMHLDLGAVTSQLRDAKWARAGLTAGEVETATIDETGVVRRVHRAAMTDRVAVGSVTSSRVAFVPYDDRRWSSDEVDGSLGLDFFRDHDVWAQWTAHAYHLVPRRSASVAERIARWESGAFGSCATPACATFRIVDPVAGRTLEPGRPHPGLVLSVTRDERAGGTSLEVVLEARDRPALPRLLVSLPPHVDRVLQHLGPAWVGVALDVVDASPHPRPCPGGGGCIDLLAR